MIATVSGTGLFGADELAEVTATLDAHLAGTAGDGGRWATDDDAGAVAYYVPERMTDGTWNLLMITVAAARQGTGLGAELVRHVERELRAEGARVLLVETSGTPEFAGQRRFYAGLGYTEEARIRDFYAAGDDKVVYWKALDG